MNEQDLIIADKENNMVIEAVAGSGKTTTLKKIAQANSDINCILITYSRSLKDEIDINNDCINLKCYTFHGFAGYLYNILVSNDYLLEMNKNAIISPGIIEELQTGDKVLMIDEVQDMTPQYFHLIIKVLRIIPNARLILVGDSLQTIKGYIGARHEFLTDAENIFNKYLSIKKPWKKYYLTKSYRLTEYNAQFINRQLYNSDVIVPGNTLSENIKPDYLGLPAFTIDNKINSDITLLIKKYIKIYGIDNILILASSYSINSPGFLLADELRKYSHSFPSNNINENIYRNKLNFRTFASCKGLQSKCIIILGFDENYFMYADRSWQFPNAIPNILSVVATRAIEKLVIIAQEDKTLRTFKFPEFYSDVNILANKDRIKLPYIIKCDVRGRTIKGHSIIKHKPLYIELECLRRLNIVNNYKTVMPYVGHDDHEGHERKDAITLFPPVRIINPVCFTTYKRGKIYESISHLYQKVIMRLIQYEMTKDKNILHYDFSKQTRKSYVCYALYSSYLSRVDNDIVDYKLYIKHIFACELIKESIKMKSQYMLRQVSDFSWVNLDICLYCVNMITAHMKFDDHSAIRKFSKKYGEDIIKCKVKYVYNNIGYIFSFIYEDITINAEQDDIIQGISNELILYSALCLGISDLDTINIIIVPHGLQYNISIKSTKQEIVDLIMKDTVQDNVNIYEIINNIIII